MRDPSDEALLDAFVAAFEMFDDLTLVGPAGVAAPLVTEEPGAPGLPQWRPLRVSTKRAALDALYRQLPQGLPALFEALLLRWRWAAVDVGAVQLLANPAGNDLSGFVGEVSKDHGLAGVLLPAGFIQFARPARGGYDPVCFDAAHGRTGDDARVVQIDHEELLCHQRLRVVARALSNISCLGSRGRGDRGSNTEARSLTTPIWTPPVGQRVRRSGGDGSRMQSYIRPVVRHHSLWPSWVSAHRGPIVEQRPQGSTRLSAWLGAGPTGHAMIIETR